jgi:SAM-dependent methyltransferase
MDSRYIHTLRIATDAARDGIRLRVLEVGCNLGYVGAVMVRLGHEYVGLDIQQGSVAKAHEYYGDHFCVASVESYAASGAQLFDLVCSFEVVEHVVDPRSFVRATLNLCKPGGRVILTTPNGDQMRPGEWLTDLPPVHMSVFRSRTFAELKSEGVSVRVVHDLQTGRAGPHTWARFRRRFIRPPRAPAPNVEPNSDDFEYGPVDTGLRSPFALGTARAARQAIAELAMLFISKPIGYCLVVELTPKRALAN